MNRDEILTQLRERIVAFAASRMQRDAAEDLAQEVLIVLHDKYEHVEAIEQAKKPETRARRIEAAVQMVEARSRR